MTWQTSLEADDFSFIYGLLKLFFNFSIGDMYHE